MVIIVTGGIGSGKSEVCRMIASEYGFPVYDADSRVKALYVRYPELVDELETVLECGLRDGYGNFVPALLADRIFTDHDSVLKTEEKVFPYLISDFAAFSAASESHVVFESATVLEKPAFDCFGDAVIFVDAPVALRIERACSRDGADRKKIIARMSNQRFMNMISDGTAGESGEYRKQISRITAVISNTGGLQDLESQVRMVVDAILKKDNK